MPKRVKFIHHVIGISTALAVFGCSSYLFKITERLYESHNLTATHFELIRNNDYLGLSRVAAAKAIDGRTVALLYAAEAACQVIMEDADLHILVNPATNLLINHNKINLTTAGLPEYLPEVCEDKNSQMYFLTSSKKFRDEAEKIGIAHKYVAIAQR